MGETLRREAPKLLLGCLTLVYGYLHIDGILWLLAIPGGLMVGWAVRGLQLGEHGDG